MRFRFAWSSRKHRIGKGSAVEALWDAGEPELIDNDKLLWIGFDTRGRELELIGIIAAEDPDLVIIIHVMPISFRKQGYWK